MKHFFNFFILLLLYAVGLLIFTRGFLLNRTVISTNSSCAVPQYKSFTADNYTPYSLNGCWVPKRYDRAVVIIIDALRFDFVVWNGSSGSKNTESSNGKPLYADRLTSISNAVSRQPNNARLYRFRADAPTTTLQRLKGLTTGSLPTFVDAGANFASSEISEDNIIDQLRKTWLLSGNKDPEGTVGNKGSENKFGDEIGGNKLKQSVNVEDTNNIGKTGVSDFGKQPQSGDADSDTTKNQPVESDQHLITFMGDDTWMSLFPGRFTRSFAYPSFNVKDLHTVDNGVMERLLPEIERMREVGEESGGLIVAHLLGVDHCGHTYGPNTTVMRDKLDQMNKLISEVMGALDESTLLAVMGDHGMTRTGDHGGDSEDEVMSALFLYSKHRSLTNSPINQQEAMEGQHQTISQIDLVPSLSLLLGSPIPFSNLGRIIDDLFHDPTEPSLDSDSYSQIFSASLLPALRVNALQINRYIEAYTKQSGTYLPTNQVARLNSLLADAESEFEKSAAEHENLGQILNVTRLKSALDLYRTYLIGVREMCQSVWAQFDDLSMCNGVLICFIAFMINVSMLGTNDSVFSMFLASLTLRRMYDGENATVSLSHLFIKLFLAAITWSAIYYTLFTRWNFEPLDSGITALLGVISCSLAISQLLVLAKCSVTLPLRFVDIFGLVLWCLYIVSTLSNSFVVYEDRSSVFLTQSLFLVFGLSTSVLKRSTSSVQTKPDTRPTSHEKQEIRSTGLDIKLNYSSIVYLFVILTLLRLTYMYHSCREEQIGCDPASLSQFFLHPLSSLSNQLQSLRVVVAVVSMAVLVYAVRSWLSHYGNLNGSTWGAYIISNVCPAMVALLSTYWLINSIFAHSGKGSAQLLSKLIPDWLPLGLAKCVYVLCGVGVVAMVHSPLCVMKLGQRAKDKDDLVREFKPNSAEALVPQYYRHLSAQWSSKSYKLAGSQSITQRRGKFTDSQIIDNSSTNENIPVVFGLATAYSSSHLVVLTTIAIVTSMLLGEGLSSSILFLGALLFVTLELHAPQTRASDAVSLLSVCSLCFNASQHFFAAGHQCTIPSIRFEAAFHGFRGDFPSFLLPATLITINTFASQILCSLALPLMIYWPLTRGGEGEGEREEKRAEEIRLRDKGELQLCEDDTLLKSSLYNIHVKYIVLLSIKLLGCIVCAALHRRHLMVWKIFAPRFVYEGASFLVSCTVCLLSYAYVLRVHHVLSCWIVNNIYKSSSS